MGFGFEGFEGFGFEEGSTAGTTGVRTGGRYPESVVGGTWNA